MTNGRLILFMFVWAFAAAVIIGGIAAWLTGDYRVIGLVGLAAASIGAALTGYYHNRVSH